MVESGAQKMYKTATIAGWPSLTTKRVTTNNILVTCEAGIAEAHCIIRNDKRHAMKERGVKHDLTRNDKAR